MYYIYDYSAYDNYTVEAKTANISSVVDKLLRLTTKITEHYAGDIVYLINALNECVEKETPLETLIAFREDGVNWYGLRDEGTILDNAGYLRGIQLWYLKHTPDDGSGCHTVLKRVMAKLDAPYAEYVGGY